MSKKISHFYFPFLFLFFFLSFFSPYIYALPTQNVEIITNKEYFEKVHYALEKANKSIQIIMFEAVYYEKYPNSPSNILIQDLIKAKKRGVKVEVILEIGIWDNVNKNNIKVGKMLSDNGINVRYDSPSITTHAKLIIIDKKISIVGSNNWTYYSLTKNNETSVIITSKEVARVFGEYFEKIVNK